MSKPRQRKKKTAPPAGPAVVSRAKKSAAAPSPPISAEAIGHPAAETLTAILNAIPAHIALLDADGVILTVNESWKRFASANVLLSPDFGVGGNYLEVCERATGDCSDEAAAAGRGLRRVLHGEAPEFSLEYPCHSPTEQRWFRLMVTPVSAQNRAGAVVMHINITERRLAEEALAVKSDILTSVTESLGAYLERGEWQEAMGRLLRTALAQTRSEYGFVGVVVGDASLRVLAHEGIVWDKLLNRDFYEQALRRYEEVGYLEFTNFNNLFGRAITTGRVVMANMPDSDARSGGRPKGHPPMHCFLGVPISAAQQVQGVIALANKPGGYSKEDQQRIETLVQHAGGLCRSYREHLTTQALEQERRKTEEALRTSEHEQRRLAEQLAEQRARLIAAQAVAKVGSWETDLQTFGVHWSAETHRIFETDPAVFTHTHAGFLARVHPEDRAAVGQAFAQSLATCGRHAIEHRLLMPDGRIKFVEERWQVVCDAAARPLRAVGTCQEITERKQAELSLRESNEKFHQLVDNITDVFWIRSPDMRELLYISPGFEHVWGRPRESLRSNPAQWIDYIVPEDRAWVQERFAALTRDTPSLEIEYRIVRPAGEIRWVRARGFQIRDDAGRLVRLTGIATDITVRKQTEERLQREESLMGLAGKIAKVAGWSLTVPGLQLYWSRQVWEMVDYPAGREPSLKELMQYYLPESRRRLARAIARCAHASEPFDLELQLITPAGRRLWARVAGEASRDPAGRIHAVHGAFSDITVQKQAEQELWRTNRALQLLSNSNETLIRAEQEPALLGEICRIAVEQGGYRMAWVGYAQEDAQRTITPIAHAGVEEDYLAEIKVTWDGDQASGQGPAGQVIRTGQAVVWEDFSKEPAFGPWQTLARERGYAGVICLPLREAGRTFGLLGLYTGEVTRTGAEELKLLQELADDLAFGILSLRARLERRRAQEALRASEAEFRILAEAMPQIVWVTRADGWNIYFNQRWMDYTGLTLEESLGHGWNKPFHPDDRQRAWDAWQHATATGGIYSLESRLRRADGAYQWWLVRGVPQFGPTGEILKWFGTCTDIDESKRAEAALRASEEEFRQVTEALPQIVWVARPDGWHIHFNQRWLDYTGLTMAASLGHGWNPPFHPEDRPRAAAEWKRATEKEEPYEIEYRLRRADGVYRWMLGRAVPLRDAGGAVVKWLGTCTDIDEFKRAQTQIAEQAGLIDEARDAIIVRDLQHIITFWSRGAERLYGWTSAEALGRPMGELLKPTLEKFHEAIGIVLREGAWSGEIQKTTRSGATLTLDARWTLLRDAAGQPKSILAIDTDITERKKLEQQFLRAQRMESIGTLAGGIAHDLNNLLAPITMGVDLLKLFEPNPRSLPVIENIERSAKRGADLVKQVLSFARGVEGARVALQVRHILKEVESIATNTFPKNINVETSLPQELWPVLADPTQLNQVLLNLCVNARDAMPNGGRLELAASNVEIDAQYAVMNRGVAAGRYVVIQVTDTGIGMPKEIIDRIFEPFFTTKELGKGTGLGLSTVLGIVRSHGGFVNVYSEPGKGSTFKVYLPAMAEGETPDQAGRVEEALPRGNGELILVVDDETSILDITKQTLQAFGYRVVIAEDGAQAIGLYAQQRDEVAVILTDMMMPVMDGPALIAALRRINPQVRIIAASGLNANGSVARAAAVGVKHFLPKPYTADALLVMIRQVLTDGGSRPPM